MKTSNFRYNLPEELIALEPCEKRSSSRLLGLSGQSGTLTHNIFSDLPNLLRAGDLLVFNDSKVVPAKLEARRHSAIGRFHGALHGVKGILNQEFIDLDAEPKSNLEKVARTPSAPSS